MNPRPTLNQRSQACAECRRIAGMNPRPNLNQRSRVFFADWPGLSDLWNFGVLRLVQWIAMNLFIRPLGSGLRLVAAGLALFCGLAGSMRLAAEQVKDLPAKPAGYVSDFAHVLSPGTVSRL